MGLPSDFEAAYELIRAGRARVHVDSVFPLAEAAKAHERLESGAQFGKVVLPIPRANAGWRQPKPRMNFASSDMRSGVHGGSKVSSASTCLDAGHGARRVDDAVRDHRRPRDSPSR